MAKNETAVIRWARTQRAGDPVTKAVLLVLASHSDRHGVAFPSQRTIAEEVEVSQPTAARHVRRLAEIGLVEVVAAGVGRAATTYRLAADRPLVSHPGDSQADAVAKRLGVSQAAVRSETPGRFTTDAVVKRPAGRSETPAGRSETRRRSDQHFCGLEVVPTELEELTTEDAASRLSRPPATRPGPPATRPRGRTRGGGSGEHVPAAELDRTAHSPAGYTLVAVWAASNPGVLTGHRRELGRAVEQVLAQGGDPELIPAALDAAHHSRWRWPARALPHAYDDIRRARRQPAEPRHPTDARIQALLQDPQTDRPTTIGEPTWTSSRSGSYSQS